MLQFMLKIKKHEENITCSTSDVLPFPHNLDKEREAIEEKAVGRQPEGGGNC